MYESHQDTATNDKHTFPEPNTYDYASQLMFDANAFATMTHPSIDLNTAYLDFFQQQQQRHLQQQESFEMLRYQTAMQQSHDYASSCSSSSNTTPPTTYPPLQTSNYPSLSTYPMMAFHAHQQGENLPLDSSTNSINYPIPYDHHHAAAVAAYMNGPPMPSLSASTSSTSSLSSSTDRGQTNQVYVRKACVSCKQSHVACDVQRPCARCVRLNKADTCVDAERKKRGRPCGSSKKKKETMQMAAAAAAAAYKQFL
ncbi:hypothetical protein CU098_012480 [Rhizopus stolonifer]|uniref:Zn(2)-C6 fungal-type domain-containing protein n=1 Tax=Rhizopus stolonifer TaxID=4846 RepID=A0A367KUL1_RHIST|nr:hypothetical protein CU098_012480 [Rhizopus stolonifer]